VAGLANVEDRAAQIHRSLALSDDDRFMHLSLTRDARLSLRLFQLLDYSRQICHQATLGGGLYQDKRGHLPVVLLGLSTVLCERVLLVKWPMDFKLSDLEPKPSNWLDLNLRYEGDGSAEFTSPKGSVNGLFVATFDEFGDVSIKLSWKTSSYDPDYLGGVLGFLFGATPEKTATGLTIGFGGLNNPCKELSFRQPMGLSRLLAG